MLKTFFVLLASACFGLIQAQSYELGSNIENFNLQATYQDKTQDIDLYEFLQDQQGAVIVFTCNHCPFSIAYEDRLIELDKIYKQKGYPLISINPNDPKVVPDDDFPSMISRSKEKGFTFPYLFDAKQSVFPLFGATKTPHCFIVQKNAGTGEIRLVYRGAFDDNRNAGEVREKYLENALNELIQGKEVSVAETKAFGCSIKVAKN